MPMPISPLFVGPTNHLLHHHVIPHAKDGGGRAVALRRAGLEGAHTRHQRTTAPAPRAPTRLASAGPVRPATGGHVLKVGRRVALEPLNRITTRACVKNPVSGSDRERHQNQQNNNGNRDQFTIPKPRAATSNQQPATTRRPWTIAWC